ncbi:hypothetical protein KEM60_01511 [Austwickia sp. TVS 96-490-7B]|uniref:hypothetical protein n=1 Tax=Austwickia sp. TVS 96-490-7B TaxID=2830843 RepID=UPI001C5768C8|nr:hypothetical protein [Austwickia sp. TVS 96-490-7B]MBW3085314.1 hypothetical protein [Austwickia sp. TVS 96-490-7B]
MSSTVHSAAAAVPLGPATSTARLAQVAATGGPAVRLRVAAHLNIDRRTLELLAQDEDQMVRRVAVRRLRQWPDEVSAA